MKTIALCLLIFGSLGIRFVRWLAWAQQKEYRLDRLWLFISSPEGQQELLRVLPKKTDFSFKFLKRPRVTFRVGVVAVTAVALVLTYLVVSASLLMTLDEFWLQLFLFLVVFGGLLVLVPFFILASVVPSAVVSFLVVQVTAKKAQHILKVHAPIVIGVTGSFGKTSTKQLLGHVLGGETEVFITPASHNTLYSVCKSIVAGYRGQKFVVLEYGAYSPGEIAKLAQFCPPKLAVVTGFAPQHLGLFGSEEAIITAKSELVAALPQKGIAFYNAIYPKTKEIVQKGSIKNDVTAIAILPEKTFKEVSVSDDGELLLKFESNTVKTKLLGKHYSEICALVVAVAEHLGVSQVTCAKKLESFIPTNKFISRREMKTGALIIDDGGTSNPQGFESALELLAEMNRGPKVMITPGIVDLGDKSDEIHRQLGAKARSVVQTVLYVGESGKTAFMQGYTGGFIDSQEKCLAFLQTLPTTTVILLEGRMPGWILEELT